MINTLGSGDNEYITEKTIIPFPSTDAAGRRCSSCAQLPPASGRPGATGFVQLQTAAFVSAAEVSRDYRLSRENWPPFPYRSGAAMIMTPPGGGAVEPSAPDLSDITDYRSAQPLSGDLTYICHGGQTYHVTTNSSGTYHAHYPPDIIIAAAGQQGHRTPQGHHQQVICCSTPHDHHHCHVIAAAGSTTTTTPSLAAAAPLYFRCVDQPPRTCVSPVGGGGGVQQFMTSPMTIAAAAQTCQMCSQSGTSQGAFV